MAQSQPNRHAPYLSSHHPSTTMHHEWRTASNSAAYLLPTLTQTAHRNPSLTLLDVGAGSGTITASLAPYMPQGKIIATDISNEILQRAKQHAEKVGVGEMVETREANVYELPFEDGEFDVVHASMVLAHLDDPLKAVGEMIRVAKKPGGVVAMRESDLRAWSIYPEYPGLRAFNKVLCTVHERNVAAVNAGAQLVSWTFAQGVRREQISATAGTWCYSTPEERKMWGGTMADRCKSGRVRAKAIETNIATEMDFKEMADSWEKWIDAEDGWFGSMHGEVLVEL